MKYSLKVIVVALAISLVGGTALADSQGYELRFAEQERGIEPYTVRVLLTDEYMRMDDGQDEGDFLLMQRADGRLLSVTHDSKSVLEIPRQPVTLSAPQGFKTEDGWTADKDAPPIAGKPMWRYQQTAGAQTCVDAVIAEGLLPEVTAAFQEFHLTLSGQQAQTLDNTPKEFRTPCFLARMVFARAPFLERGFPVLEWDSQGYRRQLIDFSPRSDFGDALFKVPEHYERYGVGGAMPL